MFQYSYTDLYRAADLLWPGQADSILANPTDTQIAMIVALLDDAPVERFVDGSDGVVTTGNDSTKLVVKFHVAF